MDIPTKSGAGWRRLSATGWTVIATLVLMALSATTSYIAFLGDEPDVQRKATVAAMALPVALGAPALFFLIKTLRTLSFKAFRMQIQATHDGMTRFFNKTAFQHLVEKYLSERVEPRKRQAALLVIDADNFKSINDTYGHAVGDKVIRTIADKIRSVVRHNDIVGRIGGEEFGILLLDSDEIVAKAVAERLRSAIYLTHVGEMGEARQLSVSVGGILFGDDADFEVLYKAADGKLYEAKAGGRNQVRIGQLVGCFAPAMA